MKKSKKHKTSKEKNMNNDEESMNFYMRQIENIPLLSPEEEAKLARRIRKGDKKASDELVLANLRFVISEAKKLQGRGVDLADLVSAGNLGLLSAAKKYDERKGTRFITYAIYWVKQAMNKTILKNSRTVRLPQNRVAEITRLKRAENRLLQNRQREPTVSELSKELGVSEEEVKNTIEMAQNDISMSDNNLKNSAYFNENSENSSYLSPEEAYERTTLKQSLLEKLQRLSEREATVLKLYFGLDEERPHTLQEIGKMNNISRERVRQIKERALKKLRAMSKEENEENTNRSNSRT